MVSRSAPVCFCAMPHCRAPPLLRLEQVIDQRRPHDADLDLDNASCTIEGSHAIEPGHVEQHRSFGELLSAHRVPASGDADGLACRVGTTQRAFEVGGRRDRHNLADPRRIELRMDVVDRTPGSAALAWSANAPDAFKNSLRLTAMKSSRISKPGTALVEQPHTTHLNDVHQVVVIEMLMQANAALLHAGGGDRHGMPDAMYARWPGMPCVFRRERAASGWPASSRSRKSHTELVVPEHPDDVDRKLQRRGRRAATAGPARCTRQ